MCSVFVALAAVLAALVQYVNPFVGTDAHGHTFPGACAPFGMVQLSPDTRPRAGDWDGCSGYHYSDSVIYGFSHTHLSGTGCDDWCDILITPGSGPSRFSHMSENASPGYYEVWLEDAKVLARMTAGRRVGMHEYTFEGDGPYTLTLNLRHRDPLDDFVINTGPRSCSGKRISSSWARGQELYFYIEFSSPATSELQDGGRRAVFTFDKRKITLQVALSSVSEENARANLKAEGRRSFACQKKATRRAWEAYMSKLKCPYDDLEHRRRFYTALYHTGIHPSLYSDANGEYRGMDGKVHRAEGWERYTVFSTWDTFRGEHPLLFEIEPGRSADFINSMISIWEENGKLPVWELSGYETDCMIGYNSAPIIADAVARGIKGFDVQKAFEAMVASSLRPEHGMESFRRNGLVLADDEHESVSKTLEFAYNDWCVAQVAKHLGKEAEYQKYMTSSQYWRNVFDPGSGFMRARLNGRWYTPFDPREVNNNYTEANSWQYSFFVPHDIPGLVEAMGGKEAFERRLDSLFTAPEGTTGRTQADITGCIGQYAHGNEPSHHIPYLYNAIGREDKAKATVDRIMETLYSSAPDGLCGNDDCGQMSAWYVLSSVGRYPVCPGAEDPEEAAAAIVTNPWFEMDSDIFTDEVQVAIEGEGNISWRIAGLGEFHPYTGPFTIKQSCTLEAYSEREGKRSFTSRCTLHKAFCDRDIELHSEYSGQYSAGGPTGLIDNRRGSVNWRTGGWQGYQDTDFEAVVDLREAKEIMYIAAGFLQDARSWIWMPSEVEFLVSEDGENYTSKALVKTPVDERDMTVQTWECSWGGWPIAKARYVKVKAKNFGAIPEWHPGAGYPAFIFIDEITIQ
ncbi:MAG: GH92 family glycosyl hydrolase [Bacteroidales bacterium]|nr:GH92 family glycosyl hydrolase [Bacteroidales bacterium]